MDLLNAIDEDAKEAFAAGSNGAIVSVAGILLLFLLLLIILFVCLECCLFGVLVLSGCLCLLLGWRWPSCM